MTAKEIQKRNAKAESLRVLQADDGSFYVESEKGKILYNVILDDEKSSCTCGDFTKNSKKDPNFQCKHMLAVLNAIPKQEIENARYCEKHVPRLDDRFMTNIKGKDFVLYVGVLDLASRPSARMDMHPVRVVRENIVHQAVKGASPGIQIRYSVINFNLEEETQ